MRRYETLETSLGKVDLSFAETVLNESYHTAGSSARSWMQTSLASR
jgi:hypothetical protein